MQTQAAAGDAMAYDEIYFDGRSNARRRVSLRLADALQIFENDSFVTAWAYADIRRVSGTADVLRLRSVAAAAGARCRSTPAPPGPRVRECQKAHRRQGD